MKTGGKKVVLIVILVLGLFLAEIVRERIAFFSGTRRMEHSYWNVRPGMTRDQVVKELGTPSFADSEPGHDDLYWSATRYQGFLLKRWRMQHYTITVSFGPDDRVTDIVSGMN